MVMCYTRAARQPCRPGFDDASCWESVSRESGNRRSPEDPAKATGCSRKFHQFDSVAPLAEPNPVRFPVLTA
jgi:hypothetical protein